MLAYAPLFPHPKEEKWNFIVADTANNTVFNRQEVSLIEAEAVGISHPVSHLLTELGASVLQCYTLTPVPTASALQLLYETSSCKVLCACV